MENIAVAGKKTFLCFEFLKALQTLQEAPILCHLIRLYFTYMKLWTGTVIVALYM